MNEKEQPQKESPQPPEPPPFAPDEDLIGEIERGPDPKKQTEKR